MAHAVKTVQVLVERHPLQQFHDDVGPIVNHIEVVELDDIGVAKSGDGLCLITKSASEIRIDRHVRMKDLHGHWMIESRVTPNVDVGHASGPDKFLYPHLRKDAADPVIHLIYSSSLAVMWDMARLWQVHPERGKLDRQLSARRRERPWPIRLVSP